MRFVVLVLTALVFHPLQANAKGSLEVTLSAEREAFPADLPVDVTLTVTNVSDHPVKVLDYRTAVHGIQGNILSVLLGDRAVDYTGRLYKRLAPSDFDTLLIEPGKSVSGSVSLDDSYDFSVSGKYTFQYQTEFLREDSGEEVVANSLVLEVEGRKPKEEEPLPGDGEAASITGGKNFSDGSCTSPQMVEAIRARENALNYADDSYDSLVLEGSTPRYATWFGAFDGGRHATVRENFRKIREAIDYQSFVFYCDCFQPGTFAYVYANKPYGIHLCPEFWRAAMTGRDSKAGTLIHEVSHFQVTAGTQDIAYTEPRVRNLAATNPAAAIRNADSHEYFAEATPYSPYNPCAPQVYSSTGAPITASWDGANCHVMYTPAGTSPFIYNNSYYTNRILVTSCPYPSSYDGANCYLFPIPSWNPSHFVYGGNFYLRPGPGNACPSPSWFDGGNCYVMTLPDGSTPFRYNNALYVTKPLGCPAGVFDGANCYIGTAPASRKAFLLNSSFYYEH